MKVSLLNEENEKITMPRMNKLPAWYRLIILFSFFVDIMPYSTEDKAPIQHDLFDRFLQLKEGAEEGGKL